MHHATVTSWPALYFCRGVKSSSAAPTTRGLGSCLLGLVTINGTTHQMLEPASLCAL
jgi:hypothetical protein